MSERRKNILTVPKKKGFVRRIVNDTEQGQRIADFLRAGWRIVEDEHKVGDPGVENLNKSIGSGVRKYVGDGTTGVLMEIEEHLYKADQKLKESKIRNVERGIFKGEGVEDSYGSIKSEVGVGGKYKITKED
jgi:hypothetical protein